MEVRRKNDACTSRSHLGSLPSVSTVFPRLGALGIESPRKMRITRIPGSGPARTRAGFHVLSDCVNASPGGLEHILPMIGRANQEAKCPLEI